MDFISGSIKEFKHGSKNIGTDLDAYYHTAQCQKSLEENLPHANFINANNLVNWIKIIKSEQEIAYIKKAAVIVENTMQVAFDSIDIGVRQNEAAAKVYHAQIYGTEEYGGDYASIIPLMPSGVRTSTPHLRWTAAKYKDWDPFLVEIAGNYQRYHCPFSRIIIMAAAPQQVKYLSSFME